MYEQHQRTIDRLVARFKDNRSFRALIIVGSVARGTAGGHSDVDIVLVASDREFERRKKQRMLNYNVDDVCDYEGGYVDGKIVNLHFLTQCADHGSEPARAQFKRAIIAYSHIPDLESIMGRIPVYQENERSDKMKGFYAQMLAHQWFMGEAEKRADIYLSAATAARLALFGGRLILAHNRIFYPYHKWFMGALRQAPDKPVALVELLEEMLRNPSTQTANDFCKCIYDFKDWEEPEGGWVGRFVEDSEWNWLEGNPPIGDA